MRKGDRIEFRGEEYTVRDIHKLHWVLVKENRSASLPISDCKIIKELKDK